MGPLQGAGEPPYGVALQCSRKARFFERLAITAIASSGRLGMVLHPQGMSQQPSPSLPELAIAVIASRAQDRAFLEHLSIV